LKSKISKILGIGLTFVLLASLMVFALPAAAGPGENTWSKFVYPTYDPAITAVGPMAEAIDGTLYAYVAGTNATPEAANPGRDDIFKSIDDGRTWTVSAVPFYYGGGAVVDMVCSELSEDVLYVTDGNYVYRSINGGVTFMPVAAEDLEAKLMGACGTTITGDPITSIDVAYDGAGKPMVFIGTKAVAGGPAVGSVYWIADQTFSAMWTDLQVQCYGCYDIYSVGAAPDFATSSKVYAVVSRGASLLYVANGVTDWAEVTIPVDIPLKDINELKFWEYIESYNPNGYSVNVLLGIDVDGDGVFAADLPAWHQGATMHTVAVLNGDSFVQMDGATSNPATGVWTDTDALSIGQWWTPKNEYSLTFAGSDTTAPSFYGSLADLVTKLIPDPTQTSLIIDAEARVLCVKFVIGGSGSWMDETAYVDNATINGETYDLGETHVISTIGTICSWTEVSELKSNGASFGIAAASRIAFPDDFADTNTLFVGVVGETVGGDVFSVTASSALDLNVASVNPDICSLDITGNTGDASLIAGANTGTKVYYSTDGGWNWAASAKNPTGNGPTYALWVGDSALAATTGAECAVSMSCGEEVGKFWNQISRINTDIDTVLDISHTPGYTAKSGTLFMLTNSSLLRYDQTNWERVFCSTSGDIDMVLVSPDFDTTNAVFVANSDGGIWRSTDAGCSWTGLRFSPATISSWVVIDEDTVIVGGNGAVYKTTRYGTRPWDGYAVTGAGLIVSLDVDGDAILLGDNSGQVFISEDAGATWTQVGSTNIGSTSDTSVAFDPGYAVSGDPGENTIYAAAGSGIYRFVVGTSTAWTEIYGDTDSNFWGIQAVGDTALYVGDRAAMVTGTLGGMMRSVNATDAVPEFEPVATGLGVADLNGLLASTGGNVLWAIDQDAKSVWTYKDTLATPVIQIAPADGAQVGTTGEATLTWEALVKGAEYEINFYRHCPQCPDEKIVILELTSADTCIIVTDGITGLVPGTTYYWQVRVAEASPLLSKWSDLRSFDTALGAVPDLCSPICGSQDIILTPNFSWDAVPGAASYEVEIATNEDFSPVIASGTPTVNAWAAAPELDYSTTYYWHVRAVKDGVVGAWSVCLFTTMDEPAEVVEPGPPVVIEETEITPMWIWVIIGIGGALTIAVIVLIVMTRRVP